RPRAGASPRAGARPAAGPRRARRRSGRPRAETRRRRLRRLIGSRLEPPIHESAEHAALREQARRFARAEVLPYAHAWDEAGECPRELYRKMAESGGLGLGYPEAYGGSGGDLSHVLAAADELILEGKSIGFVAGIGSHRIALPPILSFGTEQQKQRF